jgi:hypothetical protein
MELNEIRNHLLPTSTVSFGADVLAVVAWIALRFIRTVRLPKNYSHRLPQHSLILAGKLAHRKRSTNNRIDQPALI